MALTWEELDKIEPSRLLLLEPGLGQEFPPVWVGKTVTIGMAAHGNLETTLVALRALFASVCGDFELLLVDDASPDLTGKLFEILPKLHRRTKVFRIPKNIEYSGSLNTILSHASGNTIIFLSNDIFVSPAYIAELLSISDAYKDAGIVRGCSNFVDNGLSTHNIKNCGDLNNFMALFCFARQRSEEYNGKWLDDPFLTGDAFLVTRSLLDNTGYLDRGFFGYFVDHDLGIRARQAGFRPKLALGAFAWHQDRANFDYLPAVARREKLDRRWARVNQNWAYFKLKYGLPVEMPYEGVRRIPWDGLASSLPLAHPPQPSDNSRYCLPEPESEAWVEYRASSLCEQAKKAMNLANLQLAESLCLQSLDLAPHFADTYAVLGAVRLYQGQQAFAIKTLRHGLKVCNPNTKLHSNLLMAMNYDEKCSQRSIYLESRRWERQNSINQNLRSQNNTTVRSRIRIAYLSPDFRRHSVAYFFLPLLEHHSHEKFEIFCISDTKKSDDITRQLSILVDGWRNISGLSNEEAQAVISEVAPDILVDLAGHTGDVIRLGLFSKRISPVQLSWLGYPNTTGLSAMDFRITDSIADPPGSSEHLHSENLLRMPDCFICYKPPAEAPVVSTLPAIDNGFVTFGSFNILPKIQNSVIVVWANILRIVPGSRLLLKNHFFRDEATLKRIVGSFKKHGIMSEQLILRPSDPDTASHLEHYNDVDIALDTFPYNGTTTTCEALWMGVPVIALSGNRHAGRVGATILTAVGLQSNIAFSTEEYIRISVSLASDIHALSRLRCNLRGIMTKSTLCSAQDFTTSFEQALMSKCQTFNR